jgi:hypothetical protein
MAKRKSYFWTYALVGGMFAGVVSAIAIKDPTSPSLPFVRGAVIGAVSGALTYAIVKPKC